MLLVYLEDHAQKKGLYFISPHCLTRAAGCRAAAAAAHAARGWGHGRNACDSAPVG